MRTLAAMAGLSLLACAVLPRGFALPLTASNVGDLRPGTMGSEPQELVNVEGILYFTADNGTNGRELWSSNPKTGETKMVIDLNQGPNSSSPSGLVNFGAHLYFAATDGMTPRQLWVYDPERGTTERVVDTDANRAALSPEDLAPLGPFLFFTSDDGAQGRELWFLRLRIRNGQPINVVNIVRDITPGAQPPESATPPRNLTRVGETLFFIADQGMGYRLWRAIEDPNAVAPMASMVRDVDAGEMVSFNGLLYFTVFDAAVGPGSRLWRSDGTAGGTVQVDPNVIVRATDTRRNLVPVDNQLFFPGSLSIPDGAELFVTDGMVTRVVKDIYPGFITSNPRQLTKVFGVLFLSARDGIFADPPENGKGQELWRSDGTLNGTRLVKDIFPTPDDAFDDTTANSSSPAGLTECAGIAFFGATDADAAVGGGLDQNLWTSEGTEAGTERVGGLPNKCNPDRFTIVNTTVFFTATDTTRGRELWKVNLPDADGDGLLDKWETDGIDYDMDGIADLDLRARGARPNHKDVFVEVDFMVGAGHTHDPRAIPNGTMFANHTLERVVTAFANTQRVTNPDGQTGIDLHAIVDEAVPEIASLAFSGRGMGPTFQNFKRDHFGFAGQRDRVRLGAHRQAFRYAVFGHTYAETPESSGVSTGDGPDLMTTLGSGTWENEAQLFAVEFGTTFPNEWFDCSAGTFMHELGHTLGLRHGGGRGIPPRTDNNREINFKPNYLSVMSYGFQRNRVGQALRLPPNTDGSRVRTERPLDYSGIELPELRENLLDEAAGIGFGPAGRRTFYGVFRPPTSTSNAMGISTVGSANGAIDWNGDGFITGPTGDPGNINFITPYNDSPTGERLLGHDDWSNLVYNFRDSFFFLQGDVPGDIVPTEETLTEFHQSNFGGSDGGNNCAVCHKGRSVTLACNSMEYQRHLDHGDEPNACAVPP